MENLTAATANFTSAFPPPYTPPLIPDLNTLILSLLTPLGLGSILVSYPALTSYFIVFTVVHRYVYPSLDNLHIRLLPYIASSLTIDRDDWDLFVIFSNWLAAQPYNNKARNLKLTEPKKIYNYNSDGENEDDDLPTGNKTPYTYMPLPGWHLLWMGNVPIMLYYSVQESSNSYAGVKETFQIFMLGRTIRPLKQLVRQMHQDYLQKERQKTVIYRSNTAGSGGGWKRCLARYPRPLDTVVLEQDVKDRFVEDVGQYLDPTTARWYAARGIPYRRGYLFHGPPGTGKSSLSVAVAGVFKLRIYVINLAAKKMDEETLYELFGELPTRCVVLLEDIDSAFTGRTAGTGDGGNGLSFSGLLNVLDGVGSQEGRIVIMTTNHLEKLDPALIRPGRVDMKLEFPLANTAVLEKLFERMFKEPGEEDPNETGAEEKTTRNEKREAQLLDQARRFAEMVPEGRFSPAAVQGFLLKHRGWPERALERTPEWIVDETRRQKEKKEKEEREERERKEKEEKEAKDKAEKEAKEKEDKDKEEKEKAEKEKAEKEKAEKKDEPSTKAEKPTEEPEAAEKGPTSETQAVSSS